MSYKEIYEKTNQLYEERLVLVEDRIDEAAVKKMEADYAKLEEVHGENVEVGCESEKAAQGQSEINTFAARMKDYRNKIAERQAKEEADRNSDMRPGANADMRSDMRLDMKPGTGADMRPDMGTGMRPDMETDEEMNAMNVRRRGRGDRDDFRFDRGRRNLLEVLLYNEMHKRRCKRRQCRRFW